MKLLSAGFGESVSPFTDLLFNCTRNKKCQKTFYVPVRQFSDIVLYTDLPGEPSLIVIDVLNVCDIDNEGTAISNKYVAGTKPDGSWFMVLGSLAVTPPLGVVYHKFFFRITVTIDGDDYVYFSQQYEFPLCDDTTFIRGCYPNQPIGSPAYDCNSIYYGFANNPDDVLGDINYRYIHSAYVRMASIIEQKNKLTFTAFNNKTTYKSVFNREWLFEQEIVPAFYKDVLIGIYNRGMVQVNGSEWKLSDSQDISVIDLDSKLWRTDVTFDEECKQTFGCLPRDCVLPVACLCEPVIISATSEESDCSCEPEITGATAINQCENWHFSSGISGTTIEWEDCDTGAMLSRFVSPNQEDFQCGRVGGHALTGGTGVFIDSTPC